MQITSPFATPATRTVTADAAVPRTQATDMERLALALLTCAEKCEIEAGLAMHITPPLSAEALAGLAGLGEYSTALLLDYLLEAGFVTRRRQRFILAQPAALYSLALGAPPV
jgi:hypothetical protein